MTVKTYFEKIREDFPKTKEMEAQIQLVRVLKLASGQYTDPPDIYTENDEMYPPGPMSAGLLAGWSYKFLAYLKPPSARGVTNGYMNIFYCTLYPFPGLCSTIIMSNWNAIRHPIFRDYGLGNRDEYLIYFQDMIRKFAQEARYTNLLLSDAVPINHTTGNFYETFMDRSGWKIINNHQNRRTGNFVNICTIPTSSTLITNNIRKEPCEVTDKA